MYPPIGVALATVGVDEIVVYMDRRHNTVAQYITTRPIMDLCLVAGVIWDCDYQGDGWSILLWIS